MSEKMVAVHDDCSAPLDDEGRCRRCGIVPSHWNRSSPGPEHILQFFEYEHLPANLQMFSRPFAELAHELVRILPRSPERTVALRKLLEGKDAAVRAAISKP